MKKFSLRIISCLLLLWSFHDLKAQEVKVNVGEPYNIKVNEVGFKSYYNGDTLVSKEYNYSKRSFLFFRFKVLREGIYYSYHLNGNVKEIGAYHKGEKIGFWQEYTEEGKLEIEKLYNRHGKLIESVSYIDEED